MRCIAISPIAGNVDSDAGRMFTKAICGCSIMRTPENHHSFFAGDIHFAVASVVRAVMRMHRSALPAAYLPSGTDRATSDSRER